MKPISLSSELLEAPTVFWEGPAGSGKTTQAIRRIAQLIERGARADEILLLVPQRSYTIQYEELLDNLTWYRLGKATVGGMAQRMVALFWPLVTESSVYSFDHEKEPTFLTYETAQYFMAKLVAPLIEQGYFADLRLTTSRLYSQLIDNLNKATVNRIPLEKVHLYLRSDAGNDTSRQLLFDDITKTISAYREYLIQHNLLDFSLYNEVFWELLTKEEEVGAYMARQFRHIVYDNAEEDFPLAHDIVSTWMSLIDSACIIYDSDGGYRKFLAANPKSALTLRNACSSHVQFHENRHTPTHLLQLGEVLVDAVHQKPLEENPFLTESELHFHVFTDRLHHEMVERATREAIRLVTEEGTSPGDIAIISPFFSDSLRFGISSKLDKAGIAHHTHRPSRVLKDEPITKVLSTLATIAHPQWRLKRPTLEAITHMLNRLVGPADLVRASLLAEAGYEESSEDIGLRSFEHMPADLRDRVTYHVGAAYEKLRIWLEAYREQDELPIDHFFSRAFGESLSQSELGFYQDHEAGVQVAQVVESARKFRQVVALVIESEGGSVGKAYIEMVQEGVVSAFYDLDWTESPDAVLLAPVHTYLLRNQVYPVQLWLDVSSPSWHRRIPQPLTNPYLLSKDWELGTPWTALVEKKFEAERLERIILGLVRRCSGYIYAFLSELSPSGQERTGELYAALGRVKRAFVDDSFTVNMRGG